MSDGISCDRCGKGLLVDGEVRYLVNVEVRAAYDPMEITPEDLAEDRTGEIRSLMEQLARMTGQGAMDSVYRKLVFDLCPACQRAYLADPLGRGQ
jgi:hypothetical protein